MKNNMKQTMYSITAFFTIGSMLFMGFYAAHPHPALLPCAITFGTTAYHFIMRLTVGTAVNLIFQNQIDPSARWFQTRKCEDRVYEKWNVKSWKEKLPSYDPSLFSHKEHSFDEIAGAMCQAELVHEIIVILSFVPLLFAIPFGAFPIFLLTSLAAAVFDSLFVIVQRYNRKRILRLARRKKTRK